MKKNASKKQSDLFLLALIGIPSLFPMIALVICFILNINSENLFLNLVIILIFSSLSVFIALKNTKKLYNVLSEILQTLSKTGKKKYSSGNILSDIYSQISKIHEQNEHLYTALPYAQEKYLINYLNATEYYIDEAARDIIKKSINFPYNYFSVVLTQITHTNQTFDLYNSFDYTNIQSGLYTVIKDLFAEKFTCFVLPGANDTLYIVLNLEEKNSAREIDNILKNMYHLLEPDMDYINLAVGKSGVYEGLKGLKAAHTEAIKSLTPHKATGKKVSLDTPPVDEYDFSHKDESDFFGALISLDKSAAEGIFNRIIEKNKTIPLRSQKRLFNNLANIVLKAMRIKDVPFKDNKLDFEILNDILNQPPEEVKQDIESVIDYFVTEASAPKPAAATNVDKIILYIKENYAFTDLSLEYLGEYFHTASSNISNSIKSTLGIGYHEYLTTLRIDASKEYLSGTDKPIVEIYQLCGFNSQQTFYRAFKKYTGLTPLEFRSKTQN